MTNAACVLSAYAFNGAFTGIMEMIDPGSVQVHVSFLEVYNEKIYDLLAGECGTGMRGRRRWRGKSPMRQTLPVRDLAIKQDSAGRVVSAWDLRAWARCLRPCHLRR